MLFLSALSVFFIWLILREIFKQDVPDKFDTFSISYICVLAILAFICAWTPYKYWKLERLLAKTAAEVAKVESVDLQCNTLLQSAFYEGYSYGSFTMAGLAFPEERKIILQYPWCKHLMNYLDDPYDADNNELFSVPLFTHEVMHIRGELNEIKTECQAVQRNDKVAQMLGVPSFIAIRDAIRHYDGAYQRHAYFSPECAKGKSLDERLDSAVW